MRWIIGDVHGCFAELIRLLQKIDFRSDRDHAIFLGDLVDRGSQSKDVLDFVQAGQAKGCFQVVRGNHEDDWMRAVRTGVVDWFSSLYPETWKSLAGRDGIKRLADWTETLPFYVETECALLIHGGMIADKHYTKQDDKDFLWSRNSEFIPAEYRDNKLIVHGHTPSEYPIVLPDRINIDTGCVFGGHLTTLSLDALERGEIVWQSVEGWGRREVC
ncbi:metallophosphoesterase [Alicyclobacillus fodiniaquatilis]|jgi:serine/threonine protein phosphatase 1|uniref:Metallophosphoesterase n=1 Tax=Alicyclobacillus fodiniaquatilis TaxID=1661150 RepID=A0ABW4JKZ5_9BACL